MSENRRLALRFFDISGPQTLYIVMTVLGPQITLMRAMVAGNESVFELTQFEKTQAERRYRITELLEGMEQECMFATTFRRLLLQMANQSLWTEVTATEATASTIFRTSMRAASVCHELLVAPLSNFPARLFSILRAPASAAETMECLAARPCMGDPFSHEFLSALTEDFGPSALSSPVGATILESISAQLMGNIYDIERTHTGHATRSKGAPDP